MTTNLKGISSHKLAREIGITQKSAWHMLHRIRESWNTGAPRFFGPVEVDETYVGGKEGNEHEWKKLNAGRGTVGKTAIIGIRDRDTNQIDAEVVESTDARTLTGFVHERTESATMVLTDEARMYDRINRPHQTVKHSAKEYVNGAAHTNAIESFWATLKRAHYGVYHRFSIRHLPKYVNEFAGRHSIRPLDTIEQMSSVFLDGIGKRMRYTDLIDEVETRQPKMISYSDRQVFRTWVPSPRVGIQNFENRTLFHGDDLQFLHGINTGRIDLVYADPPFNKSKDFHAKPDSLAHGSRFEDRWVWEDDVHEEWEDTIWSGEPGVHAVIEAAK